MLLTKRETMAKDANHYRNKYFRKVQGLIIGILFSNIKFSITENLIDELKAHKQHNTENRYYGSICQHNYDRLKSS